jgi:hypothetical protein
MTYDKATEIQEELEAESKDYDFVGAVNLLAKYGKVEPSAQHDQMWLQEFSEKMSDEDVIQMFKYGFFLDEDSWSMFT